MIKIRITKWSSNSVALLRTIPKENLSPRKEVDDPKITFGEPHMISQIT